jgi:hypothetical protein
MLITQAHIYTHIYTYTHLYIHLCIHNVYTNKSIYDIGIKMIC